MSAAPPTLLDSQQPEQQHSIPTQSQLSSEPAPATTIANGLNGSVPGGTPSASANLNVLCGPLLNFRRMSNELSDAPTWHGSALIVVPPSTNVPSVRLSCVGAVDGSAQQHTVPGERTVVGEKLFEDQHKAFWRFNIEVPVLPFECSWRYALLNTRNVQPKVFVVPSKTQSMRIMFHSCNGFSIGVTEDAWSGPALWNDVLRFHKQRPFHVMLGGGDQIYNDNVRVAPAPLAEWTSIKNPKRRRDYKFTEELRLKCDDHYYNNYIRWYGQEPFKDANCVIPQVNIWDDHDIIDGFGSYTDHFMRCHVFRGIGGVAHKYGSPIY
jgi:PhoD-like phosphatase